MRDGIAATLRASALALLAAGSAANAEDGAPPRYDWSGFYVGAHLGGALSLTDAGDPFGASLYGDTMRAPGPAAGGQAGYNWQFGHTLVGLEAEASWADLYGTETCFAFSGFFVSANCRADVDAFGTLAARLGWLVGPDADTLLYAKAGAVWLHGDVDATTGGDAGHPSTQADGLRWGWMVGAGAERALSQYWSLRAEYEFLSFGSAGLSTPVSDFQTVPGPDPSTMTPVGSRATDFSQDLHLLKVGLNYHLQGTRPVASDWVPSIPAAQPIAGTTLEIGARYVYGWGRFQKDLGNESGLASLNSRLTYDDMRTNGAEMFARLDAAPGWMVKGFVGKGNGNGKLNDEDWGLPFATFIPYSNTYSKVDDEIRYGVIDVGYDVWRDVRFRATPFIGYSSFHQYMQGFGCIQLANPNSDCGVPISFSREVITEDDRWHAMRLGMAVDFAVFPGLTLSVDAAYLPYVHIAGVDDHVLRSLVSPEWADGTGAQLELMLKYALTDRLRVGIGGRYWTMWTSDGVVNFGGEELVPMRFAVEQAALLVQGSYMFEDASE